MTHAPTPTSMLTWMSRALLCLVLAGCGSASAPVESAAPSLAPTAPSPPADAAVDTAPNVTPDVTPDAGPDFSSAEAWVFRYHTAQRSETWTLRTLDGAALLVVDTAAGERRYVGSATERADGALVLDVSTGTAKMALECKREQLAVSAKCGDRKAKPREVLNCYHADFSTPMPFAPAPGVEYVVDATCNGYRLIAP
jgi:hypothetical protein